MTQRGVKIERPANQEWLRYGQVSHRGHVAPASIYEKVGLEQELRWEVDGCHFACQCLNRLVLMRVGPDNRVGDGLTEKQIKALF